MRYKQAKEFLFYFLKNEIWFTTNYNWEWLWNCHNDNHQNPILHKLVSIKHHHWNIYLLWDFINFIHVIVQSIFSGLGFQDLDTAVLSGRKRLSIPTLRTPRELKLQESGTPTYGHHTFNLIADNWLQSRHRPIKVPWATLHKCGTKTFGLTKRLLQIDSDSSVLGND
jgi:hypothetical protein